MKLDAPFSHWVIAQTFDTASDCEREKAARKARILPSIVARGVIPYCHDFFLECIASDEPAAPVRLSCARVLSTFMDERSIVLGDWIGEPQVGP